jgi:hypothetical protein
MRLLATVIALVVAVIAYFQWWTAHLRYILDLFDKRFEVYEALCTSVGDCLSGKSPNDANEALHAMVAP